LLSVIRAQTLTCIPGVIEYKDARIQLLDLPGIIEGAAKGKGRGRQVIGVARTSDLVVMMLDASKAEIQKELLTQELDAVGIRINRQRPNVTIKQKKAGGVSITSTCGDLTHLDVHQVRNILHLYKVSSNSFFLTYICNHFSIT
jgi:small GTP-binding protein